MRYIAKIKMKTANEHSQLWMTGKVIWGAAAGWLSMWCFMHAIGTLDEQIASHVELHFGKRNKPNYNKTEV